MALTYLWLFFIVSSYLTGIFYLLIYKDPSVLTNILSSIFEMAKLGAEISIGLIGTMTLWLGFMKIGEEAGVIKKLSQLINPIFKRLFPSLEDNHPAFAAMLLNISANILGLDDAATPMGLKAMKHLQDANKTKDTASDAQIMFLVINTSGLSIIPISIMVIRTQMGAQNPTDVLLPIIIATFFSTFCGILITAIIQKINLLDKVLLSFFSISLLSVSGLLFFLSKLPEKTINTISSTFSSFMLLSIIIIFLLLAFKKRLNIYNIFIDGAKEGFSTSIRILPHLVGILVALGMFRTSGLLNLFTDGLKHAFYYLNLPTDFVDALPVAFMKPISGSAARGMMIENIKNFGVDSFIGKLSSIFNGSTDTTFYILAVYFGYVNIKNTRYAVWAGLLADLAGIIASIVVAYIFFK